MPLRELRRLHEELGGLIAELESGSRRMIDILDQHYDPSLVAEVLSIDGDVTSSDWRQLERIYCCADRCAHCPHGDHWFRYRRNKRNGTVTKYYVGTAFFPHDAMERLRERAKELRHQFGPPQTGRFVIVPMPKREPHHD